MDGKGFAVLGVGVVAAAGIIFFVSRTETNTAERAVQSNYIQRQIANDNQMFAEAVGNKRAADVAEARAKEADAALTAAKERQKLKEAAEEVRNGQLVEAAAGDVSKATGKPFDTGPKSVEDMRKALN